MDILADVFTKPPPAGKFKVSSLKQELLTAAISYKYW
jgi:hypothetical protein